MTREDILAVVTKHIREILDEGAPPAIDPDMSMADYELNSLDIVEVVSHSMRELRVTVPRAELTSIQNIRGLVDLLHSFASGESGS